MTFVCVGYLFSNTNTCAYYVHICVTIQHNEDHMHTHQGTHTCTHATSDNPLVLLDIRGCGSSSTPNKHHDMFLCFPAPSLFFLIVAGVGKLNQLHFLLLFQKNNNC